MSSRNSIGSDVTGLSATFLGERYREGEVHQSTEDSHLSRTLSANLESSEVDSGFGGVEIERISENAKSNAKTASFTRNGKRYHLTTTLKTGLEVYHWFTQDQWEKIADHMDTLGEGMGGDDGLQELIINLSSESALGYLPGMHSDASFDTREFPIGNETMQQLIRYVSPLINTPIISIPNRPYASLYNERPLLPDTSASDKKKGLKVSWKKFGETRFLRLINAARVQETHSIHRTAANGFVDAAEQKLKALDKFYDTEEDSLLNSLTRSVEGAELALEQTRKNGTTEQVKAAQDHLEDLQAKKVGLENKNALQLAVTLHHSPAPRSLTRTGEKHLRTPLSDLEHCLQNAFDARLVLCEKEGLIGLDGTINLDTEAKVKKYQEITDVAALLIPHRLSDTSKTDSLINAFYAGGVSLNAITSRATVGPEASTTYPAFLPATPPQRGPHSRTHEQMRILVSEIIHEDITPNTRSDEYAYYGFELPGQRSEPSLSSFSSISDLSTFGDEDLEDPSNSSVEVFIHRNARRRDSTSALSDDTNVFDESEIQDELALFDLPTYASDDES